MKRITTQDYVTKAKAVHGEAYDYSITEYVTAHTKILIRCKKHDRLFSISANNHLRGSGCSECGNANRGNKLRNTTAKFIEAAVQVHGSTYDYSLVEYQTTHSSVKIVCKLHGEFSQQPANHLQGKGCPCCKSDLLGVRSSSSQEDFLVKAFNTHGNTYSYKNSVYRGSATKLAINCKEHGEFWQQPDNHLYGQGCPRCAKTGYSIDKSGCFYILRHLNMTKVGITNLHPTVRAKSVSKSFGGRFDIIKFWRFENGEIARNIESDVLKQLCRTHDKPSLKFDGSTECFIDVDPAFLSHLVKEKIEEFS